jgi:hypothetical protein
VAFGGGAVLCVGPNDHRAVESQHLADLGCQSFNAPEAQTSKVAYSKRSPAPSECADSLLHSDAELVSQTDDASGVGRAILALRLPLEFDAGIALLVRSRARAPDLPPALRAHRTTVLLI